MMIIECRQCESENIILKEHAIICVDCGYEVTPEFHFAEDMAEFILRYKKDGETHIDSAGYECLIEMAEAYKKCK